MNNDLISRSALLKEINENKELFEKERVYIEGLVLNAPTVAANIQDLINEYNQGFNNGYKAGKSERTQGEWIEQYIMSCGNILRIHADIVEQKCDKCGLWSIRWYDSKQSKYCSNCGSEMKGGKK